VGWKYKVTPEQFVVAWQTSFTLAEVAVRLGMPEPIASARDQILHARLQGLQPRRHHRIPRGQRVADAGQQNQAQADGEVSPECQGGADRGHALPLNLQEDGAAHPVLGEVGEEGVLGEALALIERALTQEA
jgi:hypothetical protein